mmetsp:Transcript_69230/g.184519  ORF Transcript_69230/g.184519 Transcript_69230/m.184519 type:complete len:196 (+) Transcript_69230:208-795(+)
MLNSVHPSKLWDAMRRKFKKLVSEEHTAVVRPQVPHGSPDQDVCWLPPSMSRNSRVNQILQYMEAQEEGFMCFKTMSPPTKFGSTKTNIVPVQWINSRRECPTSSECRPPINEEDSQASNPKPLEPIVESVETSEEDDDTCIVCMERQNSIQLFPCAHRNFCRRCIVETLCTWNKASAPTCPMCRTEFDMMVLFS